MFQVDWRQSALDELAQVWLDLDSSGRQVVSVAARQIDRDLAAGADSIGESRTGNYRIHFVRPLGLIFELEPGDRSAVVTNVWYVR